jgi:hypothetical protein
MTAHPYIKTLLLAWKRLNLKLAATSKWNSIEKKNWCMLNVTLLLILILVYYIQLRTAKLASW